MPDLNCWGEETLRTATLHLQGLPCGGPLTNCLLKGQIHLYYWQGVLLKENGSGKPGSPETVCWVGMGSQFTHPWGRGVLAAGPGQVPQPLCAYISSSVRRDSSASWEDRMSRCALYIMYLAQSWHARHSSCLYFKLDTCEQ